MRTKIVTTQQFCGNPRRLFSIYRMDFERIDFEIRFQQFVQIFTAVFFRKGQL